MESRHFSHNHGLVFHQIDQGSDFQCSGCKSKGSGNVYVCWQCSYFLHENCFRAERSLKHPSHPLHPLTLLPSPTYPSRSFSCNSCSLDGEGFSYSCSECEFNMHIRCAHLPNPNPHGARSPVTTPNFPVPNLFHPYPQDTIYPPPNQSSPFPTYPPPYDPAIPNNPQNGTYPPIPNNPLPQNTVYPQNSGAPAYPIATNPPPPIRWAESVTRSDHKHPLKLYHSIQAAAGVPSNQEVNFRCDVCKDPIRSDPRVYNCRQCDFGTHLECVTSEIKQQNMSSSSMLVLQKFDKESEEIDAAYAEYLLRAKGRRAALSLLEPAYTTRYYY